MSPPPLGQKLSNATSNLGFVSLRLPCPYSSERLAAKDRNGYGPNMTVKEQVLSAIERLPEDADFKDVKDEIAFLAAVHEADDDIAAGRTVTNEEMRRRIGAWTGA
jgi:hypothetical protein